MSCLLRHQDQIKESTRGWRGTGLGGGPLVWGTSRFCADMFKSTNLCSLVTPIEVLGVLLGGRGSPMRRGPLWRSPAGVATPGFDLTQG